MYLEQTRIDLGSVLALWQPYRGLSFHRSRVKLKVFQQCNTLTIARFYETTICVCVCEEEREIVY